MFYYLLILILRKKRSKLFTTSNVQYSVVIPTDVKQQPGRIPGFSSIHVTFLNTSSYALIPDKD